jgi:hypothetical protein
MFGVFQEGRTHDRPTISRYYRTLLALARFSLGGASAMGTIDRIKAISRI